MSKLPAKHQRRSLWPDIAELFRGFAGWGDLRPMFDTHLIRLEDEIEDGRYVVRAELPGIDPAKDVDITVRDGQLTIKAEHSEKTESKGRSEFPTVRSSARFRCRPALTKTTSRPATTRAS